MIQKYIRYFQLFYRMPTDFKKVLFRVTWYSLLAEIDLKWNKFNGWKKYRDNRPETKITTIAQKQEIFWMRKAMRILELRAPWKPMCYNRAVTAKRLLRAKGIESTLHVGFASRKSKDVNFEGHAWLTIQGFFITGLVPHLSNYTELKPVETFNKDTGNIFATDKAIKLPL